MQMSISLNNSTVLVLVKSTKLRANSNSNSKLELDDFEPSGQIPSEEVRGQSPVKLKALQHLKLRQRSQLNSTQPEIIISHVRINMSNILKHIIKL